MRYVGAMLLVLLGIGLFPFNVHDLGTFSGLFMAGVSALLAFFALRLGAPGLFSDLSAGSALTSLTNVYEEIERTKHTHFIGAGGGVDSLPARRQMELERKVPKWLDALREKRPHEVTANLLKNMQVAKRAGRPERVKAQTQLLDGLVRQGIAVDPDILFADQGVNAEALRPQAPPQTAVDGGAPFEATPNMPDITQSEPISVFMIGTQCVMFHKDPPPLAAKLGIELPMTYLFSGTVYDPKAQKALAVFTLEAGITNETFFCRFDRTGAHFNMGEGGQLTDLHVFEAAVLNLACKAAGMRPEAARRINP